jgi:hypothetical protein
MRMPVSANAVGFVFALEHSTCSPEDGFPAIEAP